MDEVELEEEDSENEEEEFEWCATGESCAICEALDGTTFTSAPQMVHPHCDCEVHPVGSASRAYTDCENTWKDPSGGTWSGRYLVMHVDVEVTCWDGTIVTDTVEVDFGNDPEIDLETLGDELWDAVHDHVEELIAEHCPECTPTPVG